MVRHGLVGISGVDTRRLVRRIRDGGVLNAVISSEELDDERLVALAREVPSMDGLELASRVTTDAPYDFAVGDGPRIAVYDYGVKRNILRSFRDLGCTVRVFPASTPLDAAMAWKVPVWVGWKVRRCLRKMTFPSDPGDLPWLAAERSGTARD